MRKSLAAREPSSASAAVILTVSPTFTLAAISSLTETVRPLTPMLLSSTSTASTTPSISTASTASDASDAAGTTRSTFSSNGSGCKEAGTQETANNATMFNTTNSLLLTLMFFTTLSL
ncbi:MAG: hypothetical protein GY803_04540 [Chloroflexi bacterium]|nr:hypothetical protein [Chloroflexota bacterium]